MRLKANFQAWYEKSWIRNYPRQEPILIFCYKFNFVPPKRKIEVLILCTSEDNLGNKIFADIN
jgi:hypothetical protein